MAVTAKLYCNAIKKMLNKEIDWDSDTIKVSLHTSSYTPDQDAHDYFDDVTNQITGTGYTTGGCTVTNCTGSLVSASNLVKFDGDDTSWLTSTLTARYAVVYDYTTSGCPLIGYVDFGADVSTTAGTFQLTWGADGIFNFTVS